MNLKLLFCAQQSYVMVTAFPSEFLPLKTRFFTMKTHPHVSQLQAEDSPYLSYDKVQHYIQTLPRLSYKDKNPLIYKGIYPLIEQPYKHFGRLILGLDSMFRFLSNQTCSVAKSKAGLTQSAVTEKDDYEHVNSLLIEMKDKHTQLGHVSLCSAGLQDMANSFGFLPDLKISLFPGFFHSNSTLPKCLQNHASDEPNSAMSREQRLCIYEQWLVEKYLGLDGRYYLCYIKTRYKTQLSFDFQYAFYDFLLSLYELPEIQNEVLHFLLGHELDHLHHKDAIMPSLAFFMTYAFMTMASHSYGLSLLLCCVLSLRLSQSIEKRCDAWSAQINGKKGGFFFFNHMEGIRDGLHKKYPELTLGKFETSLLAWISPYPSPKERLENLGLLKI